MWQCERLADRILTKVIPTFPATNWTSQTIDDFRPKLRTTGLIERTVMIDLKVCCFYVV